MSLIDDIQKALAKKLNDIDSLKYRTDLEYHQSPYANMTFPELGNINIFSIASKPAKNSSPETKKELQYIAQKANNRSIKEVELVYNVDKDPFYVFEDQFKALNIDFPYRKFYTIYEHIVVAVIDHLKFYYNRARPFQVSALYNIPINRIETSTHHTPSYPSGHTMYAQLISEIASEKYPEKQGVFDMLAQKCGEARVLQGVHYPSDNSAATKIIKTIYPKLSEYYEKL